jgi:hypothetical protein
LEALLEAPLEKYWKLPTKFYTIGYDKPRLTKSVPHFTAGTAGVATAGSA